MDTETLFSAVMRIIGLLSAGRGLGDLLYATLVSLNLTSTSVTDNNVPYTEFVYGIFYFLVGLYLLRGAPYIMDFAFPSDTIYGRDPDDNNDSDEREEMEAK